MFKISGPGVLLLMLAIPCTLHGCGNGKESTKPDEYSVGIVPAEYVSGINNIHWPMIPGTTLVYEGSGEHNEVEVTSQTKVILGVTCMVVHDRVWEDGDLKEETFDWYAQHMNGDVWYFGEDSRELDHGEVISTEGSWEAGADDAQPGILIKANPAVGDSYRQEYYEGEAEDWAEIVNLDVAVTVPTGTYEHCLKTREWSALEPAVAEFKYYAPGIGLLKEESTSGGGGIELTEIHHP